MTEKVMIDHKNIHSGLTPHSCLTCGKKFTTLKFLRLHQARHTAEKKFRCAVCDASFKVRSDLTRHSKRIHKK
jgi:KRAB domain-containing zinc finger protein